MCKERFDEPLKKVDAALELSFFYKIRDTRELVNGFARSQEFINWIKEIAKGSTFTQIEFDFLISKVKCIAQSNHLKFENTNVFEVFLR